MNRRLRWATLALVLSGALVWHLSTTASSQAQPRPAAPSPPQVVTLEGPGDGNSTQVVLRSLDGASSPRVLGTLSHAEGSARRGVLARLASDWTVLAVVAMDDPTHGQGYRSALWSVPRQGSITRLAEGLVDASNALVTARGTVLVQRGTPGPEPVLDPARRALVERQDALSLDRVDPRSGALTTAWSGRGQLAFLATPLRGDEVAVYHVTHVGAYLFALDATTGAARPLLGPIPALARDFSYDAARDELVFVRPEAPGSERYEVLALPVHGAPTPRVLYVGVSDHLMPRVLSRGGVALSLPGDQGLALRGPGGDLTRLAPLGPGSDCPLADTRDGRWLLVRHSTAQSEALVALDLQRRATVVYRDHGVLVEPLGFAPGSP
jgi:hypothetical protein